jgi:O-antigen/teichoic acid export membrane protein
VLSGVVFTSLSWALAQGDLGLARRRLQQAVRGALIVLAPGCLLLIAEAAPLMDLVYGTRYAPGATMLRYQALAFAALVFLDTFSNAAMAAGRFVQTSITLLALVPLAIVLNIALIPRHGGDGAALAFMASTLIGGAIALRQAQSHFGVILHATTVMRVGLALVAPALLAHLIALPGPWLVAKIAVLLTVYAGTLWLLRELTVEDVRPLTAWLGRRA